MSMIDALRKHSKTLGVVLAASAAAGAVAISPMTSSKVEAQEISIRAPAGAPMSFADLIERVSPAVVSVQVVTSVSAENQFGDLFERFRGLPGFEDFMDRHGGEGEEDSPSREGRSLGSGFFIDQVGHIVTNNHVVEDASEVVVTLSNGDELEAEVVGTDPDTDLAVLKVKQAGDYPFVSFAGNKPPRVGDWVVAVGNPFGLGGTATAGIVSAAGRELGSSYNNFIQIDASINQGNSGGPTFDLGGNVVGVNTAIFSPSGGSVGIGFAIEAKAAKTITDTLIRDGKVRRGWLGVSIQNVTPEAAEAQGLGDRRGAQVADVQSSSPASEAGIRRGDVILGVNGNEVNSSRDLTQRVGSLLVGSTNEFEVYRDGKIQKISVSIGERPQDPDSAFSERDQNSTENDDSSKGPEGDSLYGMKLSKADGEIRRALGLDEDETGLLVLDIDRDSAFAEAGVEEGDVILEAQGASLSTSSDLRKAFDSAKAKGKSNLLLAVRKGRQTGFLTVKISEVTN